MDRTVEVSHGEDRDPDEDREDAEDHERDGDGERWNADLAQGRGDPIAKSGLRPEAFGTVEPVILAAFGAGAAERKPLQRVVAGFAAFEAERVAPVEVFECVARPALRAASFEGQAAEAIGAALAAEVVVVRQGFLRASHCVRILAGVRVGCRDRAKSPTLDGKRGGRYCVGAMLDRFDCYELCVQSPRHVTTFLRNLHGNDPRTLAEDFCGTAAVSRRWVLEGEKLGVSCVAVAVDLDAETLAKARALAVAEGAAVEFELADAVRAEGTDEKLRGADLIFVGNFSIGYLYERADLVRYLRQCKARLDAANDGFGSGGFGAFVCDVYGGAGAFRLGGLNRKHPGRGREMIHYAWRHDAADPLTGMVENSISFRVEVDGEVTQELPRAFVYRWRLWSLTELADAMRDAGFERVEIYKDVNVAPGEAPRVVDAGELGEDWIVLVAARA